MPPRNRSKRSPAHATKRSRDEPKIASQQMRHKAGSRSVRLMLAGLAAILVMGGFIAYRLLLASPVYAHLRWNVREWVGPDSLASALLPMPAMPEADIRKYRLNRLTEYEGLAGYSETARYIEEAEFVKELGPGQISRYQSYVTPDAAPVIELALGKTPEQLYAEALRWVWVEDAYLHGAPEVWLYPANLLLDSPNLPRNPRPGLIVSDCESQAYTLVSLLRANGMPAEQVRVVLGMVSFSGVSGGHAWVELYDFDRKEWFALEATSGSYYNSATGQLAESEGLPFDYYRKYKYPSVQVWNYFNDVYFWDNKNREGTIPENWLVGDDPAKQPPAASNTYEVSPEFRRLRNKKERIEPVRNITPVRFPPPRS
ncbi:MAG: transglutaminase-like domain-containing protein [Patescibacteria group bacterium]|nr:transglutaminase-like domain-containing protein [Patescibacteria group bacterium]